MDREILFSGKRTDNGEWVEGDLINLSDGRKYIVNNKFGACIDDEGNFTNTESPFVCEVIPETVGQYTGLTDKNGKKIFEGDIVKTHYANTHKTEFVELVIFEGGGFRAKTKYKDNSSHSAPLYNGTPHLEIDKSVYMDSIEVIGNIHDNPELLEVSE